MASKPVAPAAALAVFIAIPAVAIALFFLLRKPAPSPAQLAVSSAPAAVGPTPAPLSINGVQIPSPRHIDPTELLPAIKRRVTEPGRRVALAGIDVLHAKNGVVDVEDDAPRVVYRLLLSPEGVSVARGATTQADLVTLTLAKNPPALERRAATAADKPLVEPTCVWSAAWQAATASGLADTEPVDATYAMSATSGAQTWVFTPSNRPKESREVDGLTCAIKTH